MSLTDPRNASDLLSAPGDFTTVDQSGDVQPLKTYGILRIKVQDEDNEQLDLAGDMKIYLDADKVITWSLLERTIITILIVIIAKNPCKVALVIFRERNLLSI